MKLKQLFPLALLSMLPAAVQATPVQVTMNTISTTMTPEGDYSISVPSDAELFLGIKFTHFTDFTPVEPQSVKSENGVKTYTYRLANSQIYNYRTWKAGGLTHGGYFTMSIDEMKQPEIAFTDADYAAHSPSEINHSPQSNQGYETGDIFVNASSQGIVRLNPGDTFNAHAMRTWELTDNSTNNYFIEPDFHYTITGLDGKPSTDVIEISQPVGSAWATIKAKAKGTAIVTVTYDGINLNYYSGADKKDYLGGQYWGAIWPENTAVYIVTVGEPESTVVPNMLINEEYNLDAKKNSGKYVDAEHDVFYYLDTEGGYSYTFTPENVANVEIAYPTVGEHAATYSGFTKEGVTVNADGSVTVLLKEGRQIVRLTDAAGRATYQVIRARACHREITVDGRPDSKIYQPGDKVKIQYSGLYHPANKLAGIYNMSAYVTYNSVPNGSSFILGSGQYTFGSAPSAQAVTVTIPEDFNFDESKEIKMNDGVIQVNGYGDPIGNHRVIDPVAGRSPNFTAVAHKTYFGAIPEVVIPVTPVRYFDIKIEGLPEDAEFEMTYGGKALEAGENGLYTGTYGVYSVVAKAKGYECYRHDFTIPDDADGTIVFTLEPVASETTWDGVTLTEPAKDAEGAYLIGNGAELAFFANMVNTEDVASRKAKLTADINLGNYDWTPVGSSTSKYFFGEFDGQGHTVENLYISTTANYNGLFGVAKSDDSNAVTTIRNLSVNGSILGKQYNGGILGYGQTNVHIIKCANYATVNGGNYTGGVVGYFLGAGTELHNCFNVGAVSGNNCVGGVIGNPGADLKITNIFSVGEITGNNYKGACLGGSTSKAGVENSFSTETAGNNNDVTELVTAEQMASGEVAYKLGDAFFQTIGTDSYPVFEGLKVYFDDNDNTYYNRATGFALNLGEGNEDVIVANNVVTLPLTATYDLSVEATPAAARLPEITWTSSDVSVVEVDYNGTITAVGKGVAIVTVSGVCDSGTVSYTFAVNVIEEDKPQLSISSVEIDDAPLLVYDIAGRLILLNATEAQAKALTPGFYIFKRGAVELKVLVK